MKRLLLACLLAPAAGLFNLFAAYLTAAGILLRDPNNIEYGVTIIVFVLAELLAWAIVYKRRANKKIVLTYIHHNTHD
jgi:uncharacterized membrane protein